MHHQQTSGWGSEEHLGAPRERWRSACCLTGLLILLIIGPGLCPPAIAEAARGDFPGKEVTKPGDPDAGVATAAGTERFAASEAASGGNRTVRRWFSHRRWLIGGLLSSVLVMAGIEMWKTAARRGRRFTQGRLLGVTRLTGRIQRRHQVAGLGVVFLASLMLSLNQANGTLEQENLALQDTVRYLQQRLESHTNPSIENLYGVPPVPHRPNHPRRISGIYYRGNCERLDEQQPGNPTGNFRTAMLHVGICDVEDRLIDAGDSIAGRELFLRVEMERSPFTDDALFSSQAMNNRFFSHEYHRRTDQFESPPVRFQELQRDQRWVAYYPLDVDLETEGTITGLVYLYRADTADETAGSSEPAKADLRYGISYELCLRDGRLTDHSDVYMGALFCHPGLAIPQPGRIPLAECFSHIAIPEKHSSSLDDPELLGISEYLEQNSEPQLRGPSAN